MKNMQKSLEKLEAKRLRWAEEAQRTASEAEYLSAQPCSGNYVSAPSTPCGGASSTVVRFSSEDAAQHGNSFPAPVHHARPPTTDTTQQTRRPLNKHDDADNESADPSDHGLPPACCLPTPSLGLLAPTVPAPTVPAPTHPSPGLLSDVNARVVYNVRWCMNEV